MSHIFVISLANVLLLFFIFSTVLPKNMAHPGLSISLPSIISSEPVSDKGYIISIAADDTLYLDRRQVSLDQIKRLFDGQRTKGASILIKADKNARIASLGRVWDATRQAGFQKISIATND